MAAWKTAYEEWESSMKPGLTSSYATETHVFETIQSFGPNTTSSVECEGIPRLRFTGNITSTQAFSVTVTKSYQNVEIMQYKSGDKPPPKYSCFEGLITGRLPVERQDRQVSCSTGFVSSNLFDDTARTVSDGPCEYVARCKINPGDEAVLIYWPPPVTTTDFCGGDSPVIQKRTLTPIQAPPQPFVTSAITFRGRDLYHRGQIIDGTLSRDERGYINSSVLTGPFTFTYPYVYLAHHPINADITTTWAMRLKKADGEWHTTMESTTMLLRNTSIMTLNSTDIFSIRPIPPNTMRGVAFAKQVAQGKYDPQFRGSESLWLSEDRPFNYGHLKDPVPASVYYEARSEDCFGVQGHCETITVSKFDTVCQS